VIKSVIKLSHDLNAKAGQLLVHHEDGNVYAVDRDTLDGVIRVKSIASKPAPVSPNRKDTKSNRPSTRVPDAESIVDDLLLRGVSPSNVARVTNLPLILVKKRVTMMIEQGLIVAQDEKKRAHHWYKTPEALEAARNRALHMVGVVRDRKVVRKAAQ
jgi:hypothetical protein